MWACMRWIKQTGCIFLPLNQPVKPTRTTIENHTTITSNLESALGLKPLQPSVTHCLSLMFAQTEKTCSYPLLSSNWLIISEMHWMHLLPRSIWYYQLLSNLLFGGFSQVYASHVGQLTCQQVEEHKIIGNSTNSIFNLISHLGFPNWEQSDASCPRFKVQGQAYTKLGCAQNREPLESGKGGCFDWTLVISVVSRCTQELGINLCCFDIPII